MQGKTQLVVGSYSLQRKVQHEAPAELEEITKHSSAAVLQTYAAIYIAVQ